MSQSDYSETGSVPRLFSCQSEIEDQLERVVGSRHFLRSPALQRFLHYIVEKKLKNEENQLKEYTIALEVFGRGHDFDPKRDAIVRVEASHLRRKLREYYQNEGAEDQIVIRVPKGHYAPVFQVQPGRSSGKRRAPMASFRNRWPFNSGSFWRSAALFLAGGLVASSFSLFSDDVTAPSRTLDINGGTLDPKGVYDHSNTPVWEPFMNGKIPAILVYGVPQFFGLDGFDRAAYVRDTGINAPFDLYSSPVLTSLGQTTEIRMFPTGIYTGVGEATGIYLLCKFFNEMSKELRVVRGRFVAWDHLENANLIFLSSARFQTLAKELPFPADFVYSPEKSSFLNLRPRSGEARQYRPSLRNQSSGPTPALVTVWPGRIPGRRILVLNGADTWGTQAAAEYMTSRAYLGELNLHLQRCSRESGRDEHSPFFQLMLGITVKEEQIVRIEYLTHHDLTVAAPL